MRTLLPLLALSACQPKSPDDSAPPEDSAPEPLCREGRPAAGPKVVAVSHPYDASGNQASAWEILHLDGDDLSAPGLRFQMGRGQGGPIAWAPDGSLGVAVQDDGTLGIFTRSGEVISAAWSGGIYATHASFDALGERLTVVDGNWANNGGGIYEVAIDCESGAPTLLGKIVESRLGSWLFDDIYVADAALVPFDRASGALGTPTPLFDYEDAIVGGADRRGELVYVGDYSAFSGTSNRVAIARVDADGIARAGEVLVRDPYAIVAVQGGAVVSSGFADEIVAINAEGELDTLSSELPGAAALGPDDRVLIAEVSRVRVVRLEDGALVDVGDFGRDPVSWTLWMCRVNLCPRSQRWKSEKSRKGHVERSQKSSKQALCAWSSKRVARSRGSPGSLT